MLRSSTKQESAAVEFSSSQNSHHHHPYQIKQDDKFFSKLVSKENSLSNPSFRGVSVAVPFTWETQPGTPKHNLFPKPNTNIHHHNSLTPLSPPPSYYFNLTTSHEMPTTTNNNNKPPCFKSKLLLNILLLRNILHLNKTRHEIPPLSPSSPFSFSQSSSSSKSAGYNLSSKVGRGRRRLLSIGSSSVFDDDFQVSDHLPSSNTSFPKSILCFKA